MDRMDTEALWERLCSLLDDDEQLWPAVAAALHEADGEPWDALLDGLDDAGVLASLEAEDTGMELADALVQLPRVFRLKPDLDEVTDTDDLRDAVRAADRVLAEAGHRLLRLEEPGSDAHALLVVPAESVPEIERLAFALQHRVALEG
jgi:hypothetical protein